MPYSRAYYGEPPWILEPSEEVFAELLLELLLDVQRPVKQLPESEGFPSVELRSQELRFEPEERENWEMIFTPTFKKAVRNLDRNLQGRVLSAILDVLEHPTTLRGDTVKPLTSELAGMWRYRVGDYRLIYLPKPPIRKVLFVDIGARGSVYH
jgi:mRNA-degrading endonuclease RelE of RelBE toxin-antitoxin system